MNLPNTSVNNAFDFTSTIKPQHVLSKYSQTCIFCGRNETNPLMQDGSFRQCLNCRKNFKATITQATNVNILSQPVSYKAPMFQTIRPNYLSPPTSEQK
jgi:hypothetical protein